MKKPRNFWLARLLILVLVCGFALMFASGNAPSAHAQAHAPNLTFSGGVDLKSYCQSLGYISVRTVGTTEYDWRCIDRNGNDVSLSLRAACQWQYQNVNEWDWTTNFYSVTGMVCLNGASLGGINARAFCQSQGYYDVALLGSTAYDWRCLGYTFFGTPDYISFNMDDACSWMYPNYAFYPLAVFTNFYSPTSWVCIE